MIIFPTKLDIFDIRQHFICILYIGTTFKNKSLHYWFFIRKQICFYEWLIDITLLFWQIKIDFNERIFHPQTSSRNLGNLYLMLCRLSAMRDISYACYACIKRFTKQQILDWTKFKVFADNKYNVAKIMISVLDRVENSVRKGENAGYQHFLLFPQCFQKPSFSRLLKVGIVW